MDCTLGWAELAFGFENRFPLITRQLGAFHRYERAFEYLRAVVSLDTNSLYEAHTFTYERYEGDEGPYNVKAVASMGEFGYLAAILDTDGDKEILEVMITDEYAALLEGLDIGEQEVLDLFFQIIATGLPIAGLVKMLDHCMKDAQCKQVVENGGFIPEDFVDGWTSPMDRFMETLERGVMVAKHRTQKAYRDKFPVKRNGGALPKPLHRCVPKSLSVNGSTGV